MRTRSHARQAVVVAVTTVALVGGGGALSSARADPAPPVPVGARTALAIPSAFRMATMSLGRVDDRALGQYRPVAMTQLMLRRWSPSLVVDGSFGYRTKAAVEAFQRAERLSVTGSLTRADFYRLFTRQTVRYGSQGDAVRALQISLSRNPAYGVAVDGSFGSATLYGVRQEQRAHGACHGTAVDGVVGPMTRAMTYEYEHDSGPC